MLDNILRPSVLHSLSQICKDQLKSGGIHISVSIMNWNKHNLLCWDLQWSSVLDHTCVNKLHVPYSAPFFRNLARVYVLVNTISDASWRIVSLWWWLGYGCFCICSSHSHFWVAVLILNPHHGTHLVLNPHLAQVERIDLNHKYGQQSRDISSGRGGASWGWDGSKKQQAPLFRNGRGGWRWGGRCDGGRGC